MNLIEKINSKLQTYPCEKGFTINLKASCTYKGYKVNLKFGGHQQAKSNYFSNIKDALKMSLVECISLIQDGIDYYKNILHQFQTTENSKIGVVGNKVYDLDFLNLSIKDLNFQKDFLIETKDLI